MAYTYSGKDFTDRVSDLSPGTNLEKVNLDTNGDAIDEIMALYGKDASGDAYIDANLTVTGTFTSGSDIWDRSGATVTLHNSGDALSLSGTLAVTGATTLSSTLGVSGLTTLSKAGYPLIIKNPDSAVGNAYILYKDSANSTKGWCGYGSGADDYFEIRNYISGGFRLGVSGGTAITISDSMGVSLASTLAVTGATTLSAGANITGDVTITSGNTAFSIIGTSGTKPSFELRRGGDSYGVLFNTGYYGDNSLLIQTNNNAAINIDNAQNTKFYGHIELNSSADAFYFGGATTSGSWRIVRSGDNLEFQRYSGSAWVTKSTMTN